MLASAGSHDQPQDCSYDNSDDDDSDGSLSIASEGCDEEGVAGGGADEDLEELMARMDEELEVTDVGKSFKKMVSSSAVCGRK